MYVPPGPHEPPRFGLRTWTAILAVLGAGFVWFNVALLGALPKLENISASRSAYLEDVVEVQLALAIAGLVASLAAHATAWRGQRRASLGLCGVAVCLFSAGILLLALTF
jgi:hypothetical protein